MVNARTGYQLVGDLQRETAHLALPLALKTALHNQKQVVNRAGDAQAGRDFEDAGHVLSCSDTLVRVLAKRRDVVRHQDPSLSRGPLENLWIVGAGEPDVLDADEIVGFATNQSSDDVVV
jgi:hypothetical protein